MRGNPSRAARRPGSGPRRHRLPERATAERVGIIREFSTSSTVIGVLEVARGFLAAHSRCTTARPRPSPIARRLISSFPRKREPRAPRRCRSPLDPLFRGGEGKLHIAQRRDREQHRRAHRDARTGRRGWSAPPHCGVRPTPEEMGHQRYRGPMLFKCRGIGFGMTYARAVS